MTEPHEAPQNVLKNAIFALLAYALLMGAVAGYKGYQAWQTEEDKRTQHFPLMTWGGANAVVGLAAALWAWSAFSAATYRSPTEPRRESASPVKLLFLAVAGLLGFTTVVCLGFGYLWHGWGEMTTARAAWKEPKTWLPVALILGGLGVMLISVLTVRSEERSNVTLRRLVYGYNAVLVGLLVFALLGVGNVMASIYTPHALDWTETNIYSISSKTKELLQDLETPVRVYVLLPPTFPLYGDVKHLLTTAKAYSPNLLVDEDSYIDPFNDRLAYSELVNKYEILERIGVLLVYDPDAAKPVTHFLKQDDLEDLDARRRSEAQQRNFRGEQAIYAAIKHLQQGKQNITVYFTQDSGELRLNDTSPDIDRGIGSLRSKLEKANYAVKELNLGAVDTATGKAVGVPDDAFAVVLAAPQDFAPGKAKLLEEYMRRGSARLVVLLDAPRNREGQVQPTGMETLLAGFGVQVGKDIILNARPQVFAGDPAECLAHVSPQSDPAILQAFRRDLLLPFLEVRSVRPASAPGGRYDVKPLLETPPGRGLWVEDNLRGPPVEFVRNLDRTNREELIRKLSSPGAPVAVTVREASRSGAPDDAAHAAIRKDGRPMMVVFGDATFVSNGFIEQQREIYYNLFVSSLSWLREQKLGDVEAIPPRDRKAYRLNLKPDDRWRIMWVYGPMGVLLVVAGGIAVWFARRG